VSVTVGSTNDLPVAQADSASTPEDTPVTIDVLSNDSDPDGDSLTVQSVIQGANGSVSTDGATVTYSPNANFNGTDSFGYEIADGNGGVDSASVSVTVAGTNDLPVAQADSASTSEDTPVTINVLSNDSDPDGDNLTVQSVTQGVNGSVSADGATVTYSPNVNFNGSDSFTYQITDGNGGTDTASVSVTVAGTNDPPLAQADSASTPEDASVSVAVLLNDSDPDGDSLTVQSVTQGANGSVSTNGSSVTYQPVANFYGTDTFNYTVSDGHGGADQATVTLTVTSVDDVPTANDDTAATTEDSPVTVNVLANDVGAHDTPITVSVVSGPDHGTATPSGTSILYTPNGVFGGTDAFSYRLIDADNDTATATVMVEVTCNSCGPKATLTWTPPTTNVDGTPLIDLAGYKVKYGTSSGSYANVVTLNDPLADAYVVEGLTSGITYYFVVTAFNVSAVESDPSNEASGLMP